MSLGRALDRGAIELNIALFVVTYCEILSEFGGGKARLSKQKGIMSICPRGRKKATVLEMASIRSMTPEKHGGREGYECV